MLAALLLIVLLLVLTACGQAADYGAAQPTVDAGGAKVAMTLTAAWGGQAAIQAQVAQVAPTATAYAQRTAYAQTATMDAATLIAATPTVAAQRTLQAQVWSAQQTQAANTAAADALTLAAQQTQAANTAAADALTLTARAAEAHATATAIALELHAAERNATATWEAATATAEWTQGQRRRYQTLSDAAELLKFVVGLSAALIVVAAAAIAVGIAARALWRLAGRPWVVRRGANEPLPTIIAQDGRLTVHQPDRQVHPTAHLDDAPGAPALAAQVQVTSQAQVAELARAMPPAQPRREIGRLMRQVQGPPQQLLPANIVEVEPGRVSAWLSDVEDQLLLEAGMDTEGDL
jgi:hypothetical protein